MNATTKNILVISIFSIAMAALESAVVVYLRALYYPEGFTVAMKMISKQILSVEIAREAATIVMLWAIGFLTGKTFKERFAYFLLSFAIWDIFYYVWLKVFINWPASLFDWDILFLIPITWLGPVIAPVICSFTIIILAGILLRDNQTKLTTISWTLWAAGCLLILFTFVWDYTNILISHELLSDYANIMSNTDFLKIASTYIPQSYNWSIFWLGEGLIILGIIKTITQEK